MNDRTALPLAEPFAVMPIFANGVTNIKLIGDAMSFTLYQDQIGSDGERIERVIVARVLIPCEGVAAALPEVFATLPAFAKAAMPRAARLLGIGLN